MKTKQLQLQPQCGIFTMLWPAMKVTGVMLMADLDKSRAWYDHTGAAQVAIVCWSNGSTDNQSILWRRVRKILVECQEKGWGRLATLQALRREDDLDVVWEAGK